MISSGLLALGVFGVGEEVSQKAVGSGDGFGELTVQGVGAIDPGSAAYGSDEKAALLGVLVGVVGFEGGGVVGVPGGGKAVAAFFDPAVEVGGGDLVGPVEDGGFGGEEEDGVGFDDDVVGGVAGEGVGVGGGGGIEAGGVVLGDDDAAGLGEVEEGLGAGTLEAGEGGVGADAEQEDVEGGELGGGEVGRSEDGGSDAEVGEKGGDFVAGAGKVGYAEAGGCGEVNGDGAEIGGGVELGGGEAGIAYGAVGFGVVVGGGAGYGEGLEGGVVGGVGWGDEGEAEVGGGGRGTGGGAAGVKGLSFRGDGPGVFGVGAGELEAEFALGWGSVGGLAGGGWAGEVDREGKGFVACWKDGGGGCERNGDGRDDDKGLGGVAGGG